MKKYKGQVTIAVAFDALQILGSIFGLIIGIIYMIFMINDLGGIGGSVLRNDMMGDDKFEKKCKTLFIMSVITLNCVSAFIYGDIKSKIKLEKAFNMRITQYYSPYGVGNYR